MTPRRLQRLLRLLRLLRCGRGRALPPRAGGTAVSRCRRGSAPLRPKPSAAWRCATATSSSVRSSRPGRRGSTPYSGRSCTPSTMTGTKSPPPAEEVESGARGRPTRMPSPSTPTSGGGAWPTPLTSSGSHATSSGISPSRNCWANLSRGSSARTCSGGISCPCSCWGWTTTATTPPIDPARDGWSSSCATSRTCLCPCTTFAGRRRTGGWGTSTVRGRSRASWTTTAPTPLAAPLIGSAVPTRPCECWRRRWRNTPAAKAG
mmetsp:Transcript_15267/g.44324  ORF Transcript_15267/g.44324 Transcript_15267/m.44324 type:complete len:262 (+) Transcript_15267:254-1039(+)